MKSYSVALIGFILLACLMITPAMAVTEILTGDLGSSGWNSTNYDLGYGHYVGWPTTPSTIPFNSLKVINIENTQNFKTMVNFNTHQSSDGAGYGINSFDAGAPPGAQTTVNVYWTNVTNNWDGVKPQYWDYYNEPQYLIGTGRIGYQRYFNNAQPPVEQFGGYVYLEMDTWNVSTYTGNPVLYLEYDRHQLYNVSYTIRDGGGLPPANKGGFFNLGIYSANAYTWNKDTNVYASYRATKPSGLGIQGVVNKTQLGGSLTYNTRAFITNTTGAVITSDTTSNPTPFTFNVPNDQIKICILTPDNDWYNSSTLFNVSTSVTPTPTPIAGAVYTISTNTDYVNVSGTNTVTISSLTDPSLADLKYIHYGYSDSENADAPFYEVGSTVHATAYSLIGGTWYGYDSADVDYNNAKGGLPNPSTLKWDTTSGDKSLTVTLQNSAGDYTYLYRTIHVGQGSQTLITTKAQAMDGTNGGTLGMVSMQIFNHNTQTWTNLSPNNGLGSIITPPNTVLSFYAQKAGFTSGSLLNQPARGDLTYQVPLFIGPTVGAGFVNYFVTVQDAQGYPLGAAQIVITPASGASKAATSSTNGGSQIFNLTASTLHTWTVSKSGYQTKSGSFTTGTSAGTLTVQLVPIVTPTKTVVMPTGSWTVNPAYTPSGNLTGFWSPWVNVFSMMGANTSELPLLIAGIIICFCMAAGFGMGGVLGGEVAMGFGAIFCVALGLIPIWVVLAIIILGFLFYGLKIGR